jgi:hypothetical protein
MQLLSNEGRILLNSISAAMMNKRPHMFVSTKQRRSSSGENVICIYECGSGVPELLISVPSCGEDPQEYLEDLLGEIEEFANYN